MIIYEEEKVNAFPGPKANNRSNFYRSLLLDGEKQETTDLALQPIDGSPILAHKLIIQASSSQFANLINQHTKDGKDVKVKPTISIPFAHDTVQSVMFWIYTGDVKMIEDMAFKNAFELLQMSFLYGLNELAENAVARVLQTLVPQHFIAVHQFAELCCQQYAKKNDALSTNSDVSSGVLLQVAQTLQKGLNQYMNANSQQVMQALLEAAPKQFNSGSCCGPRNESFVKAPIPSAPTAPISASSTVPSTTQGTEKDPVISAPSASSIASTPPPTTQGKEKDPVITFTLSNELAPSVPESKEKVFRYDVTKPMAFVGSMDPKIPEGLRAELMTQLTNLFRSIDFRVSV